ncbi:Aste57867_22074 [Aphanomyces stellatus]|uniref:Aste57867_22074 protein n=1 Tax=Aphanomyces stellatus TaxID=120398 RepID=A0A485LJH4_9STRA|nr:hypothetical protein As57867_022005 [Aphanomyces stellatus]VFT98742.1 Aste57867_22074 [Aphanomyces stellatus]
MKDDHQRVSFASLTNSAKLSFSTSDGRQSVGHAALANQALVSVVIKGKPQVCPDRPSFFFTNYTLNITCPTTNVFWVLRQRFSQLYAHRKSILNIASSDTKQCPSEGKRLIRSLVGPLQAFPKRRIGIDDDSIIAERTAGFTKYINALFHVRETCSLEMPVVDAATAAVLASIVHRIESSIDMPALHKKEETKWRERMARMEALDVCPEDDSTCSICLDPLEEGAPVFTNIRLGCAHAFHHECVSTWLNRHETCPLCRVSV